VTDAVADLSKSWVLPDGSELVDALEFDRHAGTLSVGFYNRIDWEAVGGRGDAEVEEWIEARRGWHAAVRNTLAYMSGPGFDSRALVEMACAEGRAGTSLLKAYKRWVAVRGRPAPPSEAVWLDGAKHWLVDVVSEWIATRSCGIIWWRSPVVGELFFERGRAPIVALNALFGAGTDAPSSPRHGGPKFPFCSMNVHGEGWDGAQYDWHENLILEPPSSSRAWQQTLGRTHRTGQVNGTVRCDVLAATWRTRRALEGAIARAHRRDQLYDEQQKLVLAVWESV